MNSTNVLHAWVCDSYVGRFERVAQAHRPRFIYASDAEVDISLSMPRGKDSSAGAAARFLEALVPEDPGLRRALQETVGASDATPWELLAAIGGDLAGGLTISVDEAEPGERIPFAYQMQPTEIASRVRRLKNGGHPYDPAGAPPRFSLAGAQGKFALAELDGTYFWPDHATPSTLIVKPEAEVYSGLELIEAATLDLANRAGVEAPPARQQCFGEETAFVVERFDRVALGDGTVERVHAEDMTQALGLSVGEKYLVDPNEIIALLNARTGDAEESYRFIEQLAFNTIIGNADAHGKNYSVLHTSEGPRLSPLYDAIPLGLFSHVFAPGGVVTELDQSLSMPLDGVNRFEGLSGREWAAVAEESGLDHDRVRSIVAAVSGGILEHIDETLGSVPHRRVAGDALDPIRRSSERHLAANR